MIVKCVRKYPTDDDLRFLGPRFLKERAFHVTPGKEYIVFGLSIGMGDEQTDCKGLWIEYLTDYDNLISAPICLFEIVQRTASRYWELRARPDGSVDLWPSSFYREYYFEDLSEGLSDAVTDFKIVRKVIESEAIEGPYHELNSNLLFGNPGEIRGQTGSF